MKKRQIFPLIGCIVVALAVYCAIFFAVAHFTFAYYEGEKTFQKSGLSITLTNEFSERSVLEYTAYYSSEEMMVLTLKVDFDGFDVNKWKTNEKSCLDYAQKIAGEYKELYPTTTEVVQSDGLIYFTFDFEKAGKTYRYLLSTHQADDAYWQVSFGCEKRNYQALQNDMIHYAQSVRIGE